MKQVLFRLFVAATALLAGPVAATTKEQPLALSLAHGFPPTHPLHAALQEWATSLAQNSRGTVSARVHPDQQLGKRFDHYDMARTGAADIVVAHPGLQIGRFPHFAAGELPLLFANATGGTVAFDAWYRTYAVQEMPDVKFCLAFVHDPGTLHVVWRKIETPVGMRGVKVRSGQNTIAAFTKSLGGSNVRAPLSELRDLLVRGVAQAVALPWQTAIEAGTDQIARNHLDLPLYTTPLAMVLNKNKYAAMSDAQRGAIDRHCSNAWAAKIAAPWAQWERAGRDAMRSLKGHETYALAPEQIAAWRAAAKPITATWAARVSGIGGDPAATLTALKTALTQAGAAF